MTTSRRVAALGGAFIAVVTLTGVAGATPPANSPTAAFAVNVFPTSVSGDWERLRDVAKMSDGDHDLTIRLVSVDPTVTSVRVFYGAEETLLAGFSTTTGPDLNVFDYSTNGISAVHSEAAKCKIPPRTVECTRMTFEQVGQFLAPGTTKTVEKPMKTIVLLSREVKGAGVVSVELRVGDEKPVEHRVVAWGSAGKVDWKDPAAGKVPAP